MADTPNIQEDGLDPDAVSPQSPVNVTVNNEAKAGAGAGAGGVATTGMVPQQASVSVGSVEFQTRDVPLAEKELWFKTYWRPAAAWIYLVINLFDFIVAPVLTMLMPKMMGVPYSPWTSLTLSNGGLFHLAFGAIIGVTAWGRTKERLNGVGPVDNGNG